MLAASTPAWLVRSLPPSELEGGFASRVIFVVEHNARRSIAFPDMEVKPADYEARRRFLKADLERIHALVGPMQLTERMRIEAARWYEAYQARHRSDADMRFSGYYGRKFDTVLKVATVLSVSESSDMVIDMKHFEHALSLLQEVESRMLHAFGSHGENPNSMLTEKVWTFICEMKKAPMAVILSSMRRDANSERICSVLGDLAVMQRVIRWRDDKAQDFYFTPVDPEKPL